MITIYRLLLVEDEPWIRKSLETILPWDELGIDYVGSAKNGEEAYKIIVNSRVDIIITDIKMPKMNGLTLIDKLTEHLNHPPKYLIISGYDDFSYAKSAIKQGVLDYILKPIDPIEFNASILKVIQKLNMEKTEQNNIFKLRLKDYVYERISLPISENNYDLFPEGSNYCLLLSIVSIDLSVIKDIHSENLICFSLPFGAYYLYMIIDSSETKIANSLNTTIEEIKKKYIVGVSNIRTSKDHSFYQAFKETENDFLLTDSKNGNFKKVNVQEVTLRHKDEICLLEFLQAKNKPKVLEKIKEITDEYEFFEQMWLIYFQLYMFFAKYLSETNSGMPDQFLLLRELKNIKTLDELELWKCKTLEPMIDNIIKISQRSLINYYTQAQRYVEDHYLNSSLSLEAVSNHLYISTPYLSNIFKSMGENFTAYVTRKRIEKAKELLVNSDKTIYQISEIVGFNDVKYFINVFKKETLYTPNSFRKSGESQ